MHDAYLVLAILADAVDDLEQVRVATENRLRSLGEVKGIEDSPEAKRMQSVLDGIAALEHGAVLNLQREMKASPLGPWMESMKGVGAKQLARLLGAIGDPYWNDLHGRPRTVSELWAYCGLHTVPADQTITGHQIRSVGGDTNVPARRRKGTKANWSSTAKSRVWLIADSCIKQMDSPYRAKYDEYRAIAATKVHSHQCQNSKRPPLASNGCGTREHPEWGAPGSPWRNGHRHAYALRRVSKDILKDLWRESRRLHGRDDEDEGMGGLREQVAA